MAERLFAVVTGGGTGGHVSPALAVAEALVEGGRAKDEIEFVGGRRGVEGRLVPEAGFVLHRLPGRGIVRRLTADNVPAALGLGVAAVRALVMALRRRPQVVITVGGYAGLAYGLAAGLLRIPLVVVNVDAVAGGTNRLLARFATSCAVAFPGTDLPRATVTGPPVRRSVLSLVAEPDPAARARTALGAGEGRRLVVVTGASLGARSLNEAAVELGRLLSDRSDLVLYHVAGERYLEEVRALSAAAGLGEKDDGLYYRLVGFDPELPVAMAGSAVTVSRAGASTVAELTVLSVASILVPLPGAPGDHQTRNAEALAAGGAAIVLRDDEVSGATLNEALSELLADGARLEAMRAASGRLGRRGAAAEVAALAEKAAAGGATRQ